MLNITPIPDREAAKELGVTHLTIRNAVKRGDLTRIPMAGLVQHVAKEQIDLFKKYESKRLTRGALSLEDRQRWEAINDAINTPKLPVPQVEVEMLPLNIRPLLFTYKEELDSISSTLLILLILAIAKRLSETPNAEEIRSVVNTVIGDPNKREKVMRLLTNQETLETLRELAQVA